MWLSQFNTHEKNVYFFWTNQNFVHKEVTLLTKWHTIFNKLIFVQLVEMRAASLSFMMYGLLLLLCIMVTVIQSMPYEKMSDTNSTSNAEIFGVPKVAKKRCTKPRVWIEGKCRIVLIDWLKSGNFNFLAYLEWFFEFHWKQMSPFLQAFNFSARGVALFRAGFIAV